MICTRVYIYSYEEKQKYNYHRDVSMHELP
jgi:hypothetical protein